MAELWTEKFFPQTFDDFVGNTEIAARAQAWATAWQKGKPQLPLLFWGQSGAGKTCLAHLVARVNHWPVVELNASDLRSKEAIEKVAGSAATSSSFAGARRLVLLDEVDGLQRVDRGGAAAIGSLLKEARQPVILTANDIYGDRKMQSFIHAAEKLEFKKINYLSMAKRLREILASENVSLDEEAVKQLARNAGGDFRSALLDAQTLALDGAVTAENVSSLGARERQQNIFKVMETIFKGKSFSEIRDARWAADVGNDLLERWVEENIPRVFDAGDAARAFHWLSRANVFNGRIYRRQNWDFLRYSGDLGTAGVGLSREKDYHGWLRFQFPTLLSKLSRSAKQRAFRRDLGKKLGRGLHSSAHDVLVDDFPFLPLMLKDKAFAANFAAHFNLDADELAFLLETTPKTKKVQSILEEAGAIQQKHLREKMRSGQHLSPLQAASGSAVALESETDSLDDSPADAENEKPPAPQPADEPHKQTTLF